MSDFPNRKAWLEYRSRPVYRYRWIHRSGTFDRSRNAEKRANPRAALADRLARRRRESWKLEKIRTAA